MDIFVIALSFNPQPLSARKLKLSGMTMESLDDTGDDNQIAFVIISNFEHT